MAYPWVPSGMVTGTAQPGCPLGPGHVMVGTPSMGGITNSLGATTVDSICMSTSGELSAGSSVNASSSIACPPVREQQPGFPGLASPLSGLTSDARLTRRG